MIQLADTEKCTGCMACAAGCPVGAVAVRRDVLGNQLPQIRTELCIACGKCRKNCPELNLLPIRDSRSAYAVWSLDPENRKTSASGGAAAEFYANALSRGWWICGAEYDEGGRVIHTLSREAAAIVRYKQSKYVYSEAADIYPAIKDKLDAGETVLMISLPCKIAGLMGYLGKKYDNLLTVDIVCHGTPSNQLLQEHIAYVAPGTKSCQLRFRQDNEFLFQVTSDGKKLYQKTGKADTYLAAFLDGLIYRESCYRCAYARSARISDLTICDFWGLGAETPFNHPYTGAVSAVLVNTDQGAAFFEGCWDALFVEERSVSEVVKGNAQLKTPTPHHPKRKEFLELFQSDGFELAVDDLLGDKMKKAQQEYTRYQIRRKLRQLAGIFLKRYRG